MTRPAVYPFAAEDRIDELGLSALRVSELPPKTLRDPRCRKVIVESIERLRGALDAAREVGL